MVTGDECGGSSQSLYSKVTSLATLRYFRLLTYPKAATIVSPAALNSSEMDLMLEVVVVEETTRLNLVIVSRTRSPVCVCIG